MPLLYVLSLKIRNLSENGQVEGGQVGVATVIAGHGSKRH